MNPTIKKHNDDWTAGAIKECAKKADELAAREICYICMKYFKDCNCECARKEFKK